LAQDSCYRPILLDGDSLDPAPKVVIDFDCVALISHVAPPSLGRLSHGAPWAQVGYAQTIHTAQGLMLSTNVAGRSQSAAVAAGRATAQMTHIRRLMRSFTVHLRY